MFVRYIRDNEPLQSVCKLCGSGVTDAVGMDRDLGDKRHNIISDIEPYKSPIDGSTVSSRSTHRDHMRQHGVVEMGNEYPKPKAAKDMPKAAHDVREILQQAGVIG